MVCRPVLRLAVGASEEEHRTADHVVDSDAERRVTARGGEVRSFAVSGIMARRVCKRGSSFPGLAMSRALGDAVAQELGVIAVPEVSTDLPFPPGSSLVLASDGVWDQVPTAEAAAAAAKAVDGAEAVAR